MPYIQHRDFDLFMAEQIIVKKNSDIRVTALASTTGVEAGSWIDGYLAIVV